MADTHRLEDLRRRVQKDPASLTFAQLAEECRRAGQFQEAVRVCREGLAHHPDYLSARVTLGRSLIGLDHLDQAAAELSGVLRTAPQNLVALRGLAEIHERRGQHGEALEYYRTAAAYAPNDHDVAAAIERLQGASPEPSAESSSSAEQHIAAPPPVVSPAVRPGRPRAASRALPTLERWLTVIENRRRSTTPGAHA